MSTKNSLNEINLSISVLDVSVLLIVRPDSQFGLTSLLKSHYAYVLWAVAKA